MPWRAKEAATSSIKSSIGAPNGATESWAGRGAAWAAEFLPRRLKPPWISNIYGAVEAAPFQSNVQLMKSPEGMPGEAKPGDVTACFYCFSIHYGGMVSRDGADAKSPQPRISPRLFTVLASSEEIEKSALGCLTYSRIWCLSRGKHNIW